MRHPSKLFIFLILTCTAVLHTAPRLVRGVVRDIGFRSVDNVSIHVKETGKYTVSMNDGYFELSVPGNLTTITLVFESDNHYGKTVKVQLQDDLKPLSVILVQKEYLINEILVTAFDEQERSITLPMAQNIMSELEVKEKMSDNLIDTLANYSPGIHFIGSGGFMATPSIRGLARRRVLILMDGVRITGDRRAGNSGEFLAPELIKQIEVVRSSSSVIYGSDAMGGVIQLMTGHDPEKITSNRSFNLSFNSVSSRISSGFSLLQKTGKLLLNTGFQFSRAENYSSPEGLIHNSGYTNLSGVLNLTYTDDRQSASLRYIGGYGRDIGKPDRENDPDSFSTVTENGNHIFLLKYDRKELFRGSDLRINLFTNPTTYILEKGDLENGTTEISDTRALNSGFGVKLVQKLSGNFNLTSGVDLYHRGGLDIINTTREGIETPLRDGRRRDSGIFITGNIHNFAGLNIRGGMRYTFTVSQAVSGGKINRMETSSPSLFLGIVKQFSKSVSFFVNSGTSFRNPSLGESYYTGITGRNYVIGNPDLDPEKGFNIDAGLKIHQKNFFMGMYLFYNEVNDMIERYRGDDGIYTYSNIASGKITGGEAEFQWFPSADIELFGHFHSYRGRSDQTGDPLNDVPSPKLFLGGKLNIGKSWFELNYLHSFEKSDPGPSEIMNGNYSLITLKGGHYFSSKFFSYLKISNLLNERYYPNPDPDIPPGDKINLSVGMHFFF